MSEDPTVHEVLMTLTKKQRTDFLYCVYHCMSNRKGIRPKSIDELNENQLTVLYFVIGSLLELDRSGRDEAYKELKGVLTKNEQLKSNFNDT